MLIFISKRFVFQLGLLLLFLNRVTVLQDIHFRVSRSLQPSKIYVESTRKRYQSYRILNICISHCSGRRLNLPYVWAYKTQNPKMDSPFTLEST